MSIAAKTPTIVTAELMNWATLLLSISRRVSVSLVKSDMSSPWVCLSKKRMGRASILVKRSFLILMRVVVEIFIISLW